MTETDPHDSVPQRKYQRLGLIVVSSALAVFGFLYQQMWTHSGGFDYYAFEYWGPRAFGVVVATTLLGISVINRGWKFRAAFGAIAGIALSFVYVWIMN